MSDSAPDAPTLKDNNTFFFKLQVLPRFLPDFAQITEYIFFIYFEKQSLCLFMFFFKHLFV